MSAIGLIQAALASMFSLTTIPSSSACQSTSMTTLSHSFQSTFETALANYEKQTGKDLSNHPFADKLRGCGSADSVLHLFQEQAQEFDEYRNGDRNLMKRLSQTVHLLHALASSDTLSEGIGLVC